MSEMTMFLSEGKSQRFTETAYNDSAYTEEIESFQNKIIKHMIKSKFFEENKIMGKYNCALDATRFQKARYEISKDWLSETKEGKTSWYLSMLDLKLIANGMAISIMNEMINNEEKKLYSLVLNSKG